MPLLKVCGTTDAAFALEAAVRGVDILGFVFAERSPRRVSPASAAAIASALAASPAPRTRLAGVFAGNPLDEVVEIARTVPLDIVQLHGGYGADAVRAAKAAGFEVWRLFDGEECTGEDATLLDGRDGAHTGGTGHLADWSLVGRLKRAGRRVVLAGGIKPENAAAAAASGADVVDVNSGIETSPGVKSTALLDALLAAFRGGMVQERTIPSGADRGE